MFAYFRFYLDYQKFFVAQPILAKCSISIPPENVGFLTFLGYIEMEHWALNGLKIIWPFYKQIFLRFEYL